MRIKTFSNNVLQVNTYFLIQDNDCLIIDPGSNSKDILKMIDKQYLNVKGIILTHAHFDHCISCNELNRLLDVPLYVHPKAIEILKDPTKNLSSTVPWLDSLIIDDKIKVIPIDEQTKQIDNFYFDLFHTPGHSPDGICLSFKDEKIAFTGDTLFKQSIGRHDFFNSDGQKLIRNIKNKLFKLPDETIIYPGHGPTSTMGLEKKTNPYIR